MITLMAIVRRDRAGVTKEELRRVGCAGYTQFPVLGRGVQRGLRTPNRQDGVAFLPKVLFEIVVEDERAQETIEALIRANQTGQFGDGRIFVLDVAGSWRISTEASSAITQATEARP